MAVRDVEGDFTAAYLAEYHTYLGSGLIERASAVAAELRARGVDVPDPAPADDGSEPPAESKEAGVENKAAAGGVETTVPGPSSPAGVELKAQAAAVKAATKAAAPKTSSKAGE